jgi:hypothetical protein
VPLALSLKLTARIVIQFRCTGFWQHGKVAVYVLVFLRYMPTYAMTTFPISWSNIIWTEKQEFTD